jgi:hypothetical protein
MRKYISLFFLVSAFFTSCNLSSSPDGIIKPNRMVGLLIDIHTADGSLMNIIQEPDTLYKYGMGRYLAAFKKFGVDSAQFRASYKYYALHPDALSTIYDSVASKMKFKYDSLNKLVIKQNMANAKRGIIPTAAAGGNMPSHALRKPIYTGAAGVYNNSPAFLKMKARRDSLLLKKHLKLNALPKQQH